MTERAAVLQAKIAAAPQAQRKVLQEELELLHHQMGPRDANGARVHCQAMWHEAQIETLDGDIKRFTLLHEGRATPADDLRLYTRRVAVKCLDEGWALSSGRAKFQVDAFGSYLANNMTMLDSLFARVSAWMTAPPKADEIAEDSAAHLAAVQKIADSITGMARVADGLDRAPAGDEAVVVPLLESYVADLRTINEIDEAISERARAKARPAAAATATAPAVAPTAPAATPTAGATGGLPASAPTATPEAAEPEPPPMTEDEKARVAAVAESARKLVGEGWDEITGAIVRYAGTVDAGFLVPARGRGHASSCAMSNVWRPSRRNSTRRRRCTRST